MKDGVTISEINYAIPTSQPGLRISTTTVFATMLLSISNTVWANSYQPIGGSQVPIWEINSFISSIPELISEVDDLSLLDIYVEPKPIKSYKIKTKVKTMRKGQTQLFPSEFE